MNPKLRIAILGAGHAAKYLHLPVLTRSTWFNLLAIAEPDPDKTLDAQKYCPRAAMFTSFEELLEEVELDAVLIALPNALHVPAAQAAFARKLHVYLEKPMATTLAEARSLISAWQASRKIGMIGLNFRYSPMHQAARASVAAGRIGQVLAMRAVLSSSPQRLPTWKMQRATGGGALLDLASHHLDLACWLIGSTPCTVTCNRRSLDSEDDTAMIQLEFENEVSAQLFVSLCAGDNDHIEIFGTRGRIVIDRYRSSRLEMHPNTLAGVRARRFSDAARAFASPTYWLNKLRRPSPETCYWRALTEFATAALADRPAKPDLLDGLQSLAIIEAAERSAQERYTIKLADEYRMPRM